MSLFRAALIVSLLATAQPVAGGKPPPPAGASNPEIAFVKISGGSRRNYELKFANEDGTGATTLYQSRDVGQMMVDLGPRSDRTFLLVQGGKLSLGTYSNSPTGPKLGTLNQIINMNHAGAATAAFSRTGTDVVYFRNGASQLWRYNIGSQTHTMLHDLAGNGGGLTVSRDGQTVYYTEEEGPETFALKSIPMAGGTPTDLGVRGYYTEVEAANSGDELALVDITSWPTNRLLRYDLATGATTYVANGYAPSYKCDDSRIVYQRVNSDGSVSLFYQDLPSGSGATLSTSGNYWPDYMPTC